MYKVSKEVCFLTFFLMNAWILLAQDHTVGVITYVPWNTYQGYNLIYPENQPTVFLMDNCGQIVHQWEDEPEFIPGKVAYLQADGSLVKTKRYRYDNTDPIQGGGEGAFVEIRTWDNELLWQFEQNDSMGRIHHDISVMPNGNILMISWEYYSEEQIINEGRDTNLLVQHRLWPDYILEVSPLLDSVVWEWHIMDHVIQDYDATKLNYGVVAAHPELIDLNWDTSQGRADWTHVNSIDYNEGLDQIVVSVPHFNEFWIIDHSTSMEESAGHTGGDSGRGGDLLYRWGNPAAYRQGGELDQKLFFQHDVHWVDNFVEEGDLYYGKIALFNNRVGANKSTASILTPVFDTLSHQYVPMLPQSFDITFFHPVEGMITSGIMSGIQILPNGNTLICASRPGYTFEMTPDRKIVWEYKTPLFLGDPVEQGTVLTPSANVTFRLNRYPLDFAAFEGKDLTPMGYLELNPDEAYCDLVLDNEAAGDSAAISIYPNPATSFLSIEYLENGASVIQLMDILGRVRLTQKMERQAVTLDLLNLEGGVYFLVIDGVFKEEVVIMR